MDSQIVSRICIALVFILAGIATLVLPSHRGSAGTAIGWLCGALLAVAFALDMRERLAERRKATNQRSNIQVLPVPSSGQDGEDR